MSELEEKQGKMTEEIRLLKLERKDIVLKRQHSELTDRIEILTLENKSLKELIRDKEEGERADDNTGDISKCSSSSKEKTELQIDGKDSVTDALNKNEDDTGQKSLRSPVLTETTEIAYV